MARIVWFAKLNMYSEMYLRLLLANVKTDRLCTVKFQRVSGLEKSGFNMFL